MYRDQLRQAVEAVEPFSAVQYWWAGVLSADIQEHVQPILTLQPEAARGHLLSSLTSRLYEDFYLAGGARPSPPPYPGSPRTNEWQPFVDELSAANSGSGTRQAGWEVLASADDGLSIRRDGLTLQAQPAEIIAAGSRMPAAGDTVDLKMPKELPAISPGFYMALSDAPYQPDGQPVVRFYWNLYAWGAVPFLRSASSRLNQSQLPYRLKLINHPDRYTRCDAAVLYLLKEDVERAVPVLADLYTTVRRDLKAPVPALTRQIAPGVGLAEEPPGGESFGMHRCRLLADGIVRGWEQGAQTVEERLAIVVERLAEAGVDIDRPYLNPGSTDDYEIAFDQPPAAPSPDTPGVASAEFLDVAVAIGREICREAFWHEGWCNWLGVQPRDPGAPAHQGMTYASLGPELYGGSSGVALFLAELAAEIGDEEFRETALGAIRQAIGQSEAIQPPVQLGYYTGRPGLAVAAARVGQLLDAADVVTFSAILPGRLDADLAQPHEHDLLSGSAGGILALLQLHDLLGEAAYLDSAVKLGERLLAAAEVDGDCYSWPSVIAPDGPNLTGFSHGAAGIGLALLELWQAAGDQRLLDAARGAFAYEQRWFNDTACNWPDFREVTWRDERPEGPFPYRTFWCHGAPGIALSRLRAWQLTGDDPYRAEAITALETTRQAIEAALHSGTANYSLCHGIAGNASVLLLGSRMLGESNDRLTETVEAAARAGLDLYQPAGREWPCGTHGGWTPGLMLGLAGTGRFYLDLARSGLPPVLLPVLPKTMPRAV